MRRDRAPRCSWALSLILLALGAASSPAQDDEDPRKNGPWRDVPPKASRSKLPAQQLWSTPRVEREHAVLVAQGGEEWLLGLEWQYGSGEAIRAWRPGGEDVETLRPPGGRIVHLCAAAGREGVEAAWIELEGEGGALFHCVRGAEGWSEPRRLETGPGGMLRVEMLAATADRGTLLVWQQEQRPAEGPARYRIHAADPRASLRPGEGRVDVAGGRFHVRDPAVVRDREGRGWVAWVESTGRDHEVRMRGLRRAGEDGALELGEVVEVSRDTLTDDLHPVLAADPEGGVWIAWDSVMDPSRGRTSKGGGEDLDGVFDKGVRIQLARYHDGAWSGPAGAPASGDVSQDENLPWGGGHPRIHVHDNGTLSLAFRYLDDEGDPSSFAYSYPMLVTQWDGRGFAGTRLLEPSEGGQRRAAAVASADGLRLAWMYDRRSQREAGQELPLVPEGQNGVISDFGPSSLASLVLSTPQLHAEGRAFVARPDPRTTRRPYPRLDTQDDPTWTGEQPVRFSFGETESYRVLFGNLHRHSCLSACSGGMEPRAEDRFALEQDLLGTDFFALTDHAGASCPYQVWRLHKQLEAHRTRDFVTLQGYEWSHFTGHHNVIFRGLSEAIVPANIAVTPSPRHLWAQLPKGQSLTIPHHSAELKMPVQWNVDDPDYLRLIEIHQSRRGSYEMDGCLLQARNATAPTGFVREALKKGYKAGIIASSDHGAGASYAVVLAEDSTREAVFDALYARRCYASTTKGVFLDFRVAGRPMGEEVEVDGPVEITLDLEAPVAISQITLLRDGEPWVELGPRAEVPAPTTWLRLHAADTRRPLEQPFRLQLRPSAGALDAGRRGGGRGPRWRLEEDGAAARFDYPRGFRQAFPFGTYTLELSADLDSSVEITTGRSTSTRTVRQLLESPLRFDPGGPLKFDLVAVLPEEQFFARGEHLGTRELQQSWTDDTAGEHWYMVRVVLANREMAWSSPVWVTRR